MTFFARIKEFQRLHRRQVTAALAAIALAGFVLGQFIPGVTDLLLAKGVIAMATFLAVLEISVVVSNFRVAATQVRIARDQDSDSPIMLEAIRREVIKKADLLEYSAGTVEPIVG